MPVLSPAQKDCLRALRDQELLLSPAAASRTDVGTNPGGLSARSGLSAAQVGAAARVLVDYGLAERREKGFSFSGVGELQQLRAERRLYRVTSRGRAWLLKREPEPAAPPPGHLAFSLGRVLPRASLGSPPLPPPPIPVSSGGSGLEAGGSGSWLESLLLNTLHAHQALHALAERLQPGVWNSLLGAASTSSLSLAEESMLELSRPASLLLPASRLSSPSAAASELGEAFAALYKARAKSCRALGWPSAVYELLLEDLREVGRAEAAGPGALTDPHRVAISRLEWDLMCLLRALATLYIADPAVMTRVFTGMGIPASVAGELGSLVSGLRI